VFTAASITCNGCCSVLQTLQEKAPELVERLNRNVGFGMGLEFREGEGLAAAAAAALRSSSIACMCSNGGCRASARASCVHMYPVSYPVAHWQAASLLLHLLPNLASCTHAVPAGANVLNIKNEKPLRAGQVFTVSLGVSGLENTDATDGRAKTYALQVRMRLACLLAVVTVFQTAGALAGSAVWILCVCVV
jgi:hypothetical protein